MFKSTLFSSKSQSLLHCYDCQAPARSGPSRTHKVLKTYILIIISRAAHIRLLQARNRRVQGFCLSPPTLNHLASANLDAYDLSVTLILLNIIPNGVPHQGVQYDVVVRPHVYSQAYLELADLYEVKGLKLFNAVPISTSLIPRHICIDTRLLYINILRGPFAQMDISGQKLAYWGRVFNINHHAFKTRSGKQFDGFIRTDGVSCSVTIQVVVAGVNRVYNRNRVHGPPAPTTPYFQDHIQDIKQKLVYIDPNRRDLLYCRGYNAEGTDETLRYTSMQRRSETKAKEHERIRSNIEVAAGLRGPVVHGPGGAHRRVHTVSLPSSKTMIPGYFRIYLQHFFRGMPTREPVYATNQFRKLKFAKYASAYSMLCF